MNNQCPAPRLATQPGGAGKAARVLLQIACALLLGSSASAESVQENLWTTVSLSKTDTVGTATLLAVVRNAERFAGWIGDRPLTENVVVGISTRGGDMRTVRSNVPPTTAEYRDTRYLIAELGGSGEPGRTLVINEHFTFFPRAGDQEREGVAFHYTIQGISSLRGKLGAEDRRAVLRLVRLRHEGKSCASLAARRVVCSATVPAVELIRAASRHGKALASKVADLGKDGQLVLDTTSAKSVTFEESADKSRLRNVTITGLVRARDDNLQAPDATSAWVVTISGNADPADLSIRIFRRNAEAVTDTTTLRFAPD